MLAGRPELSDGFAARSLSEISEVNAVRIGGDLVPAARRVVGFLRWVGDCQWLHHKPTIAEAVRRYDELWMPLISDLTIGSKPPMILPPLDVEWVWFCHTLNPESYRQYCETRFSKLIGKPAIFDEENEEYAISQCKRIWIRRYPDESFENETQSDSDSPKPVYVNEDILTEAKKHRFLYERFSAPYMSENVYLIAARLRYKGFLLILQKFRDEISVLMPASDIILMWLTHQSYPTVYAEDVNDIWEDMAKVVADRVKKQDAEKSKELWDRIFNQPYEKAGGELAIISDGSHFFDPPFHWPVSDIDVNTVYKSILPRFVLEVCIFIRLNPKIESTQIDSKNRSFLRLRVARCHRKLKLDKPISDFAPELKWQKAWHFYCEFGTRGVVLEHRRRRGRSCFRRNKTLETLAFSWNDLLRAHSLTLAKFLGKQVSVVASITPPVQASYLLKCVPDRVTDDSGNMISDSNQRMNFQPQEGRWLTRTVLDHAGRECFVVRIRIGKGVFRRGGDVPSLVKREERVTEIREGSWSYVEGSIGKAPAKVVGTVMPKEPPEDWNDAWEFSTGDNLLIRWNSSGSISELGLQSRNQSSPSSLVRLLTGRRMQYRVKKTKPNQEEEDDGDEDGNFVTVVRSTEENPIGKATALIDWKHLAVEFLPEEDAVFVMLVSISILRSVTEKHREDVGKLLVRRRLKEARIGERNWGSVMMPDSEPSSSSTAYVRPWYLDAGKLMATEEVSTATRYPVMNYSNVEGGDKLYKLGIFG